MNRFAPSLFGLALFLAPLCAQAQDSVVLEGTVAPACTLTGEGFVGLPDTISRTVNLSNPQSLPNVTLHLHVTCTQNFVIGFTPQYARLENVDITPGALQPAIVGDAYLHEGAPVAGFAGALKYTLNAVLGGVTLPSGGGGPSYSSPSFGPGVGFFTSLLPPMSAPLTITFNPVELAPSMNLLAGSYQENITIQLTPQGI